MTIERRKLTHPGDVTMWVVQGDQGAVSLMTWRTAVPQEPDGRMAGAVALHYPHTASDRPAGPCELLPGGICSGDQAFRAGAEVYDLYRATGRRDETIYAELEDWYQSRMGES
jgi:hypothetical protein